MKYTIRSTVPLILTFIIPCFAAAGWTPVSPSLHPEQINDFHVFDQDKIWAGGDCGAISIRENGQWKIMKSLDFHIRDVQFYSETSAIAVGMAFEEHYPDGVVYSWNGIEWTKIIEVPESTLYRIWGTSTENFFVTGTAGMVYHYMAGSWQEMTTGTAAKLTSIWGTASDDVYVAGTIGSSSDISGVIFHWNGSGWSISYSRALAELFCIRGFGTDCIYAAGSSGYTFTEALILFWNGTQWSEVDAIESDSTIRDIWGTDSNNFYLAGDDGLIIHKEAEKWTVMESGVTSDLGIIGGTENGKVCILGIPDEKQVFLEWYQDEWKVISEKKPGAINDITGTSADHMIAVGWSSEYVSSSRRSCLIKQWDGFSWCDYDLDTHGQLHSVWAVSEDSAFAVGAEGEYSDRYGIIAGWDGSQWSVVSSEDYEILYDVWGLSPDEYYAVGANGMFLKWDGTDWSIIEIGNESDLTRIWGTAPTDIYISAECGSYMQYSCLFHWNGSSLTLIYEGCDSISNAWGTETGNVYFLADHVSGSNQAHIINWDGTDTMLFADLGNFSGPTGNPSILHGVNAENIYAAGAISPNPLRYWDGLAWTEIWVPRTITIEAIWGSSADNLYCVGHDAVYPYKSSQFIMHYDGYTEPDKLGVRLYMSSSYIKSGYGFYVTGYLDNPGSPMQNIPVFFLLDIQGELFFWPGWNRFSPPRYPDVDYRIMDIPTGSTSVSVFPFFEWPDTNGQHMQDLMFYGAMLNSEMNAIIGEMAMKEWSFY